MDIMTAVIIITITTLWAVWEKLVLTYYKWRYGVVDGRRYRTPEDCKVVLEGKFLPGSLAKNQLGQVGARAGPNQRLVAAFGVDNAFTTDDKVYSKEFLKTAKRKIAEVRSTEEDAGHWQELAASATSLVLQITNTSPENIRLDTLVQTVAFKIAIQWLWKIEPDQVDHQAVLDASSEINRLWIASKTNPTSSSDNAVDRRKLHDALTIILPEHTLDGRENPLNLLLPAYETLWRVVLSGIIEIFFRPSSSSSSSNHDQWRHLLLTYLAHPTSATFTNSSPSSSDDIQHPTSVEHLINECLRLYPPTKRVNRSFRPFALSSPLTLSADIEACHHDTTIWGANAAHFDPTRWRQLTQEQKGAFFPFGDKPFICPAREAFGPRMVALLIAAFAEGLTGEEEWRVVLFEKGEGDDAGGVELGREGVLRSEREAYERVELVRKEG